jgi:hypothetical protein
MPEEVHRRLLAAEAGTELFENVYEVPRPLSSEVKVLAPPTALSGG